MTDSAKPFAAKKFVEINGRRMAYIDEGEGAPIVFAHGNSTSSYLWRNIMPACRGLGRLIACDTTGMGDSEKTSRLWPRPLHLRRGAQFSVRALENKKPPCVRPAADIRDPILHSYHLAVGRRLTRKEIQ